MKRGADTPEMETVETNRADRPESRADAGKGAARRSGDSGGDKVETEWRHSLSIPSSAAPSAAGRRQIGAASFTPAPGLRPLKIRANDALAPTAYRRGADAFALLACETEPDPTAPVRLPAGVLTHPTFARPPVVNARRPGRKAGAVSLNVARRQRDRVADKTLQTAAHDVFAEASAWAAPVNSGHARPGPFTPADAATIRDALAILAGGLRKPGVALTSHQLVRAFLVLHLAPIEHEVFGVLFLDSRHAVIAFEPMFRGTLSQAPIYPREVVKRAMHHNASAVILAHNHPSGEPEPSRADEAVTKALQSALGWVDVKVLDHFVIGGTRAVSLAERGLM